ncbi:hypothetical protein [Winogradskyella sp.]|uniref:hypothetical protein n=1 Tax=Winogradskyella sp. TaxID=1883156 RepID=UPI003F6BA08E
MQSLNQFGEYLIDIKAYKKAEDVLNESKTITAKLNDEFSLSRIKLGLGKIKLENNQLNEALTLTKEALKLKQSIGLLSGQVSAHQQLSNIYKTKRDFQSALNEHITFKKLSDSLYNKQKATHFDELQTKFETEKKEAALALQEEKIKSLSTQTKNDKLTKTLYGIGMFSFLTIAGLIYFGFKQRLKKNKMEREKQEEIFKQEIEFKKKELAYQTLHLVQKNTFIQELKEN